jgi:hypothetical protein
MTCIGVNTVQAYLRGLGDEEWRHRIDEHLDGCDACRALVATAARLEVGPDPPLAPGTRVSRYVIGARIGGGAMGVVHAAEDPELRRQVAIKLLRPDFADVPQASLLREAQALARVSSPHVVPVFDVGAYDGGVFLAMELVDGVDVRGWRAARQRGRREILDVYVAAGRGLAAAHAAGVVHRDFKPENVLVGADGRVRVGDFGLAWMPGDVSNGMIVGTPAYMAPEQMLGGRADARSDQYSFCVALYEALCDHRPPSSGPFSERPRPPVPAPLRRTLQRGLATDPRARFPSLQALLAALTRDRARGARRLAVVALGLLLVVTSALVADTVLRRRQAREARASFAAASEQLGHALALRYQTFIALSKVTSVLPIIREIAGNVDRADFGLGDAGVDARRLEELHENLASADWSMWTHGDHTLIAVADYKGRLVYSSAAPRAFGNDVRVLDAVARAYAVDSRDVSAMFVRAESSALRDAGLDENAPHGGVVGLLAGAAVQGGLPRAVFVKTIDGRDLLEDLSLGPATRLTLVTPDGGAEGPPPPRGDDWLVMERPISGPGDPAPIATIVLARHLDAGLFPYARSVLGALALMLAIGAVLALRPRWESRESGRPGPALTTQTAGGRGVRHAG